MNIMKLRDIVDGIKYFFDFEMVSCLLIFIFTVFILYISDV
jgi:hypothetical protein